MDQPFLKINHFLTAPECAAARERLSSKLAIARLPMVPSIVDTFQQMLLEALLRLTEAPDSQAIKENYFPVFVVFTGHFQKIQHRNVFKSGTPSELSYIS